MAGYGSGLGLRSALWAALVALWSSPAPACDAGPFPIDFGDAGSQLSRPAERLLDSEADLLRMGAGDRILVTFYVERGERRAEIVLRRKREQAIRSYLAGRGVPARRLAVRTKAAPPPPAAEARNAARPGVVVELVSGCG